MKKTKIAALLLCAGRSSRMGTNKALIKFKERSLLETILGSYIKVSYEPILIITGPFHKEIETAYLGFNSDFKQKTGLLYNELHYLSQFYSIQCGLRFLQTEETAFDGFAVNPVDCPFVMSETLELLYKVFMENTGKIIIPYYNDVSGHPAIFPSALVKHFLKDDPGRGAQTIVKNNTGKILKVPVTDPHILHNINTKEDLRRLYRFMK